MQSQLSSRLIAHSVAAVEAYAAQAILVCFRLHKAKEAMVTNAAAASLRQICIELFDKVVEEAKDPGTPNQNSNWGVGARVLRLSPKTYEGVRNAELRAKMDVNDPHELPGQLPPAARDAYMVFQVRLNLPAGVVITRPLGQVCVPPRLLPSAGLMRAV